METFTIAEAAKAAGISHKAMRNRVDRRQLRVTVRDGIRRIPAAELERAGLLGPAGGEPLGQEEPHRGSLGGNALGELLDRLERQAAELGELRALTREADSLRADRERLEASLYEAHAKVIELEAQLAEAQRPRRWWRRRADAKASPAEAARAASDPLTARRGSPEEFGSSRFRSSVGGQALVAVDRAPPVPPAETA